MVRLTKLLGLTVRWLTRSRRSVIALVAVPILVVIALLAPRELGSTPADDSSVAGAAPTSADSAPLPTELPATAGPPPGPSVAARGTVPLDREPARIATEYVTTVNTHDARPGADAGPLDSYRRARGYVTAGVYRQITEPSKRGDYQWTQWSQQRATVSVRVVRAAVPDGAPPPTAGRAHVRVQFRQVVTPEVAGAERTETADALTMIVSKGRDGEWRVSRLLPNI